METFYENYLGEDTEKVYTFLRYIDYDGLDYEEEINLFLLYIYISYKISYYQYEKVEYLLLILQKQSLLLYYNLIKGISIKNTNYYDDFIISLRPQTIFEKVVYFIIEHKNKLLLKQSKEIHDLQNRLRQELLKIIGETIYKSLYFHYYENMIEKKNPDYTKEPNSKNKLKIIRYCQHYITIYEYQKCLFYLESLKESVILHPQYIECQSILCILAMDKEKYISIKKLISCLESIYDLKEEIQCQEIKLGLKYRKIDRLIYTLLRIEKNMYIQKYKEDIEEYYDFHMKRDDFDQTSFDSLENIETNYYGFLRTFSKENEEKYKEYTLKCIEISEKKKKSNYTMTTLIDLIILYYSIKDFQKVSNIYHSHKSYLMEKTSGNNFSIILFNMVIPSLILNHEIQSVNELKQICVITKNNPIISNNQYFRQIQNIIKSIQKRQELLRQLGFFLMEEYDYHQDPKGFKNEEDQIVCPICYGHIEKEKIMVIECRFCHKYIGHLLCVSEYVMPKVISKKQIYCFVCREEYKY